MSKRTIAEYIDMLVGAEEVAHAFVPQTVGRARLERMRHERLAAAERQQEFETAQDRVMRQRGEPAEYVPLDVDVQLDTGHGPDWSAAAFTVPVTNVKVTIVMADAAQAMRQFAAAQDALRASAQVLWSAVDWKKLRWLMGLPRPRIHPNARRRRKRSRR